MTPKAQKGQAERSVLFFFAKGNCVVPVCLRIWMADSAPAHVRINSEKICAAKRN